MDVQSDYDALSKALKLR